MRIDTFKIGGCEFFSCESGKVKHVEIYYLNSTKLTKLAPLFEREILLYKKRGLTTCSICVNNKFNDQIITDAVKPAILYTYATNENLGILERRIRTSEYKMQ